MQDANGYHPETNFNPYLCKIGTQGTIREDETLLPENRFPFLNHYWTPWGDHDTWWANFLYTRNAIEYAQELFDEGVMHFADGLEQEAFFDFGRTMHLMEDMGSVPHVFSDSHPSQWEKLNFTDASGYEKWCFAHLADLHAPAAEVPVTALAQGMEALALEAFRSARISGRLNRDPANPVEGDLAQLFPGVTRITYVPPNLVLGHLEHWWLEGVGANFFGEDPTWPNREAPQAALPLIEHNSWVRVPNLPGEDGAFFYIENGQDTVVPANVWSVSAGAWVPNPAGLTLAQLWAGAGEFRASPAQEHELIPRTTAYVAGYMKHVWDFVNPPPHLVGVRVEQDGNADGRIEADAVEVVYDKSWTAVAASAGGGPRTLRRLDGRSHPAARLPVRITLRFSEPVHHVRATLEAPGAAVLLVDDAASERGPPTRDFPDGEPFLAIPDVDLSAFPDGPATLSVSAQDLSNHVGEGCGRLDPDPSSRAGRMPDGSWRGYVEVAGATPPPDRTHNIEIGGFRLRARPASLSLAPGSTVSHAIEMNNLTLPTDSEVTFAALSFAPGWTTNADEIAGIRARLPAAGSGWTPLGTPLSVSAGRSAMDGVDVILTARSGGPVQVAKVHDWVARSPNPDHPDDLESVADPRFPSPWLVDPQARLGLLLGGWGQGLGHILGRHGIATAPVTRDLEPADGSGTDISTLNGLLIGSGGLAGIAGSPARRDKLARFVAEGGVLIAFTPQRGADLAALPGGEALAGFGWSEDQACFGEAVEIAGRHVVLSGQDRATLDAGADGYLTRWPDDAQVLLRRRSNSQPAMVRYGFGEGEVFLLTLYPDFGYGTGQSSAAERALVRDLATYALARPEAIPEFAPGDPVALTIMARNGALLPTSSVVLEAFTPERAPLRSQTADLALAPTGFAGVPFAFDAPASLGIHPVGYRLLDAAGTPLQATAEAAHFAVRAPLAIPEDSPPGLRTWVTAPSDAVPRGGSAEALVHVRNATDAEFRGFAAATWTHLGGGPVDVARGFLVPPRGEAAVPLRFLVPDTRPFTLVFGIFEGEAVPTPQEFMARAVALAYKGFSVFSPSARVELQTGSTVILPGEPLDASVLVRNLTGGEFPARLALRLTDADNAVLWSEERDISLGAGERTESLRIVIPGGTGGDLLLEARAVALGEVVGLDVARLRLPRSRVTVIPELPAVWRAGTDNFPVFKVRNSGELPVAAALLEASLTGMDGLELWSSSAPVPPLEVGDETGVPLALTLPGLPFGDCTLRYAVSHAGGVASGSRTISHRAAVQVAAEPQVCLPGGSATVTATARDLGDVAGEASLTVRIPSLSLSSETPVALSPGESATLTVTVPIPEDVPRGTHLVEAGLSMNGVIAATGAIVVPPARLEVLPPSGDAAAGEMFALEVVNAGGSLGVFDYVARLIPAGADPADTSVPAFSEAAGDFPLGIGESRTILLGIPAGIASGLYAVVLAAQDRLSSAAAEFRAFVFVRGVSAGLAVSTDKDLYAQGEPVTAEAQIDPGGAALAGATLQLSVTGSGGIDPPHFVGTVHVGPGGDDATGDGSRERPYATPQRGIDAAAAGDRVLLLAGTYAGGGITLREGTTLQGEVVAREPAAVLDGIDVAGTSNVVVDHVALRNGSIVFTDAVSGVRITNCVLSGGPRTVPDLGQGILFGAAATGVLIGRNRMADFGGERAGVQFHGAAVRAVLHENVLSRFAGPGNGGAHFWGEAREVVVQGNTFEAFTGGCDGVHFWGGSGTLTDLRVLDNRFSGVSGNCGGIHLWRPAERAAIRGNVLEDLAGNAGGIHLWATARVSAISDNALRRLRGDVSGLHIWGTTGEEIMDVAVEGNLLDDVGASDELSRDNGILVWGRMRGLTVSRNVLRRVGDGAPAGLASGIVLREGGSGVEVSRNVVTQSDAGIALRAPYSHGRDSYRIEAEVSNNLLVEDGVAILEETVLDGGSSRVRDNVILSAGRAGIVYLGAPGFPATSRLHSNDLHGNAVNAEGRADPVGVDGNFSADPLLVDAATGDYRLLPGSPCRDTSTLAPLDIGPLDDAVRFTLGPRPVPRAALEAVHWRAEIPIEIADGVASHLSVGAGPIPAAGRLFLRGRLLTASGQVLAEADSPFSIRSESLSLALVTERSAYRAAESISGVAEVANDGTAAAETLVRVTRDGEAVLTTTVTLQSGETSSLPFETACEADCILHAEAGLASADLPIAIAEPRADLELSAPGAAGTEPFTITARVSNPGVVPVDLQLELDGAAHAFPLQPSEERAFRKPCAITADTTFLALLHGDATAAATATVRFGPRPGLALETLPLYPAGPVSARVVLSNSGTLGAHIEATVTLLGIDSNPLGTWMVGSWLGPGESVHRDLDLGALAPGEYSVRAEGAGAPAEARFRVAPEIQAGICGIEVAGSPGPGGFLPVTVCLRNTGAARFAGMLALEVPFAELEHEVALAVSAEVREAMLLPVAGLSPGDLEGVARLTQGGAIEDQRAFTVPLRAGLELASVAADVSIDAGTASDVAIGVRNAGTARGVGALRLYCGDFLDETRTLTLGPGEEQSILFAVSVPADLPSTAGCPAAIELTDLDTGNVVTGSFTVRSDTGFSPYLAGVLTSPAYRQGDTAVFLLSVGTYGATTRDLRVIASHGDYRRWSEVTVAGGPIFSSVYPVYEPAGLLLAPWAERGTYTSSALDVRETAGMLATWQAETPPGSAVLIETRTGPTAVPGAGWSPWGSVAPGGSAAADDNRFLQYRVTLTAVNGAQRPALHEIRFDRNGAERAVRHATYQDFARSPLALVHEFPVDFAGGEQVFFGAYEPSGRSILLDSIPIRRVEGGLALWTDLPSYSICDTVVVTAAAEEAGILELRTPWGEALHTFDGPGTATFSFTVPEELRSGTCLVEADFLGVHHAIPVEVYGHSVGILSAVTDRSWYLPGETARFTTEVTSSDALEDVTVDIRATGSGATRLVSSSLLSLADGYNRLSFDVPIDAALSGAVSLDIVLFKRLGEDPRALFLAGGQTAFDVLAPNRPPEAHAGPDILGVERAWIRLDGGASLDPDGDPLLWRWRQTGGPAARIHADDTARPLVLAPEVPRGGGVLSFALTVSDGYAESPADTADVLVSDANRVPVASAGTDMTRGVAEHATLDGSLSFDPDGDPLAFRWELAARPEGSGAFLDDAASVAPVFVVDRPGEYEARLVVSDGLAQSTPDTVHVSTVNSRPTADAGADRTARPGEVASLSGETSFDPDGDPLSFQWSLRERPEDSLAALDDPASATPSFTVDLCGRYVAELRVHDGGLESGPDSVAVDCVNARPVADAGADRAARVGQTLALDGSGSADPDGDPLQFRWAFTSLPAGSAATLTGSGSASPTFIPDLAGVYALSLVVSDGTEESEPDGAVMTVGPDVPPAVVGFRPSGIRKSLPPKTIQARIELSGGFSAAEIDPAHAAITAVGTRTLPRPVLRVAAKGALIADADRDGLTELVIHFPVRPLLRYLKTGVRNRLTVSGPLATWGRFVGTGLLKASP